MQVDWTKRKALLVIRDIMRDRISRSVTYVVVNIGEEEEEVRKLVGT